MTTDQKLFVTAKITIEIDDPDPVRRMTDAEIAQEVQNQIGHTGAMVVRAERLS
jgi:hypothetical protein